MQKVTMFAERPLLKSLLTIGLLSTAAAGADLSRYRDFRFGSTLEGVAKQAGVDPSRAKIVHVRPALVEELAWRPRPLESSAQTEPAKDVIFSFYDHQMFRIVISYDRYETEGLTASDLIETISRTYGSPLELTVTAKTGPERYGDREETVAQWQDELHRFELIRSSYGPSFRLVGVLKPLEAEAQKAVVEAARLDDKEAPQREAERQARESEAQRVKLEKARLANKAKFRL